MCIVRQEEHIMQIDEASHSYLCKNCGYYVPRHMDPIKDTELEAGNEVDTSVPYGKTVSFTKKRTMDEKPDIYPNPIDAWES